MRPLSERGTRSGQRWVSRLAPAALLILGACAPRAATPPPPGGLPGREPEVRVGLAVDTAQVEVASTDGFELFEAGGDRALLRFAPGEAVVVTADPAGALHARPVVAGGQAVTASLLVARPLGGSFVSLGGKPYRGTLLLRPSGGGRLTAVNQVDMEVYLLGVVPREIGKVGVELLEAAKAQAVAARTYAVKYLGRRERLGFDVYATVQDQVYGGAADEYEPITRAVRETAGEILVHAGEPIEAFYHSTCAGQTAAIQDVWPDERPRPYLVSVVDLDPRTGEAFDRSSSRFQWTQHWTAEELRAIFARTLRDSLQTGATDVGELRDIQVLERSESGRIRAMRIVTSTGEFTVGGDRIRWIFPTQQGAPLNSSKFDVQLVRDAAGQVTEVVATGGGWGHGIGMCQVGAMGRARAGQDYRTILRAYYPATEIAELY